MKPPRKIKIYMGVLSNRDVIDSQAYILRDLADTYSDIVELVYPEKCTRRIFHDFARNCVADDFLASDCDVLWFLDSDITPPQHLLDLIACHWEKWEVSGASYPVFMTPNDSPDGLQEVVYTAYRKNAHGGLVPGSIPREGVEFVDGLATGCLLIKREVFEKLSKPYFEFKFDPDTRNIVEGEDLGFCFKLGKLGVRILTDYSMICKHQKSVDLLDVNNYAISYANRAVLTYDANIKQQVAAAIKEAYQAGIKAGQAQGAKPPASSVLWTPSTQRKPERDSLTRLP